ncbi:hypothetical protein [Paraburkholderia saeva]|uniref:hypothetical protein n=1 Tax=Paraburkholderia saeva TaxID=2777537 RepID=UPI001DFBB444|nr:hypothetical protein [Paraburkholderia saeva]CAG4914698.1 hypothetical protein R52603_04266 [Paraburkholderia saeva]
MRHTVIGLFDTYTQAEAARDTLVQTGFARTDIELQANPVPPSGADIDPAADPDAGHGFMANIERFLSSLFASGPRPADPATTARYTDAVRRGAVLVCVNAASESHAELAERTLAKLGAIDIGERAPAWDSPMMDTAGMRDQSMLDELGVGAAGAVPPPLSPVPPVSSASADYPATTRPLREPVPQAPAAAERPMLDPLGQADPLARPRDVEVETARRESMERARAMESRPEPLRGSQTAREPRRDPTREIDPPRVDPLDPLGGADPLRVEARDHAPLSGTPSSYDTPEPYDDATRAVSTGAVPGSGAYMAPAAPSVGAGSIGAPVPDEFLEYEEDFRGHYDEQYAAEGARYEDYSGAYHYGAKMGQDVRYRDRQWDDIEPEARRDWETMPRGAQGDTWERFKAAVRHGWDRVTGHHHV